MTAYVYFYCYQEFSKTSPRGFHIVSVISCQKCYLFPQGQQCFILLAPPVFALVSSWLAPKATTSAEVLVLSAHRTFGLKKSLLYLKQRESVYVCVCFCLTSLSVPGHSCLTGFCFAAVGDKKESRHFVHRTQRQNVGDVGFGTAPCFWPTDLKYDVAFMNFQASNPVVPRRLEEK